MVHGIRQLVLENFKSYEGRHDINLFLHFSAIIGPNGSGKSNMMDAISFVLGVHSRQLRGGNLKELIFRRDSDDPTTNTRSSFVSLLYEDAEGKEILFKRCINSAGHGTFKIDEKTVSEDAYQERLASENVIIKAKNFLIFQGEVEQVAQKDPLELTKMFEEISGSRAFVEEYDNLSEAKNKAVDQARLIFARKKNENDEKKLLKKQKDEAELFQKKKEKFTNLNMEFTLFRLYISEQNVAEQASILLNLRDERSKYQKTAETAKTALTTFEQSRAKFQINRNALKKEIEEAEKKYDSKRREVVGEKAQMDHLESSISELTKKIEKETVQQENQNNQMKQIDKTLKKTEDEHKKLMEEKDKKLTFTAKQQEEYERIKDKCAKMTSIEAAKLNELTGTARLLTRSLDAATRELHEIEEKHKSSEKQLQLLEEELENMDTNLDEKTREVSKGKAEIARLQKQIKEGENECEQLVGTVAKYDTNISNLNADRVQLERERKFKDTYRSMQEKIPGVLGRFVDLCSPSQKRFSTAITAALGFNLDVLVVDQWKTSKAVYDHLITLRYGSMKCHPIDTVKVNDTALGIVELSNQNEDVFLAMKCITFTPDTPEVRKAFSAILQDTLIVENLETAQAMSRESQRKGLRVRIITTSGEKLLKNGNYTVDSSAAHRDQSRFQVRDLEEFQSKCASSKERLVNCRGGVRNITVKLQRLMTECETMERSISGVGNKKQSIAERIALRKSELKTLTDQIASINERIENIESNISENREDSQKNSKKIQKIEKEEFSQLSKAVKIENIRQFETQMKADKEKREAAKQEHHRHIVKLKAERDKLMRGKGNENRLTELKSKLASLEEQLATSSSKLTELTKIRDKRAKKIDELKSNMEEVTQESENAEADYQKYREKAKSAQKLLLDVEQQEKASVEKKKIAILQRRDLIRQSWIDRVEIPRTSGVCEDDLATDDDVAEGAVEGMDETSAIDYSDLPEEKKEIATGNCIKEMEDLYEKELFELKVEIEKQTPNLKAIERYHEISVTVANL
eukprot:GHVL01028233.1.p1 GENE.GHVL01028233.1~~GHVL01028233.1.p1  ORF type:complete len:1035 (-),score=254.26 GHVL01028233.1:675-3779(-)